ncbi:MAG: PilC/PilY family type IV pilus protein [Methylococcales bacterium]
MKKYFILLFSLLLVQSALADDIDIYGVSTINVKPNVLIIFDNSGSMDEKDIPAEVYDPETTYSGSDYDQNTVYKKEWHSAGGGWWGDWGRGYWEWNEYHTDIDTNWYCTTAQTFLNSDGYWMGKVTRSAGIVNCGGNSNNDYRLGNFINFEAQAGSDQVRMIVAKKVIADLINEFSGDINFGVMKFNYDQGGSIVESCGATVDDLIGANYDPETAAFTDSHQSGYGAIGALASDTWTPLAETLAEAGLYFAGASSWYNTGVNYTSPIQSRCQKNYIVLVTDGEPTKDGYKIGTNTYLNGIKIPSLGHDGSGTYGSGLPSYLDDVAYFLANQDLRLDMGSAGDFLDQIVTTHTIGIIGNNSLDGSLNFLEDVATNGNGTFSNATSSETLREALSAIFSVIGAQNEQFSSSAVPVNSDDGFTAGDYVYFGLFQPLSGDNWAGNLKKYRLSDGVIVDNEGNDAILSSGAFADNAISVWSSSIDGNEVTNGGAGGVLVDSLELGTPPRTVYTYTGTSTDLSDSSNLFVSGNGVLTDGTYTDLTASVISAVRSDNFDGRWPLGSFIHSEPLVIHYTSESMIYIGANDGMLHCFDDADGSEKWGYIPQDLLSKLSVLESPTKLYYFVDGSPVVSSLDSGEKILIFGERRGGYGYTALEVSDPASPSFKYSIDSNFLGGSETLGLSWSEPQSCQMVDSTGAIIDVFLMSGGYDFNQDDNPLTNADTVGRAVYAVDSETGVLLSNFNINFGNFSSMTSSIVAVGPFENPETRTTTRVYAGDLYGNLFAFRDDTYAGVEDGIWEQKIKLFSSPGKKIFYSPNVANELYSVKYPFSGVRSTPSETKTITGDYVFYGTGDRAHPERTDIVNEFYAIKNSWQWEDSGGTPTETPTIIKASINVSDGSLKNVDTGNAVDSDDLFILDVTDDLIQNNTEAVSVQLEYANYVKSAISNSNNRGWYLRLEDSGEKVTSKPIIFAGVVYFSTFVPESSAETETDPCENSGASGVSYLYALGYIYGEAAIDVVDEDEDEETEEVLTIEDRKITLKTTGMAPAPRIVTPKDGDPYILIGKQPIDLPPSKKVNLFYWQQLNN